MCLVLFAGCGNNTDTESVYSLYVADSQSSESVAGGNSEESESEVSAMYITVNSNKLEVELAQNTSVKALVEILKQNDITYTATDYGGFEKVGNIGYSLPKNDEQITTQAGDVILYQGNNICLYYGTNSYTFTRIGKINGYTDAQLKELLFAGSGSVTVTISLN